MSSNDSSSHEESNTPPTTPKKTARRGQDPEVLARMRERAAAKRAEMRAIREADALKKRQEHSKKFQEAKALLEQQQQQQDDEESQSGDDIATHPPATMQQSCIRSRHLPASTNTRPRSLQSPASTMPKKNTSLQASSKAVPSNISYKEAFYRSLIERLENANMPAQHAQPPEPHTPQTVQPQKHAKSEIYSLARQDIVRGVNKRIMDDMLAHYFPQQY